MNKIIIIIIIDFIFSIGGSNPWAIFNTPSNAIDFSSSRANIAEGAEGFYQYTNPALLTKSNNKTYGMSYNMMSLDRSNQVVSFNIPLPPQAGLGLSIMRSGTSNIQGRDIFNNNTNIISDHEMLGMISFAVSFSKYISAGINIKASYSNLDNVFGDDNQGDYSIGNTGIGFDLGALINYSKLHLGVKIENIESSKNWELNLNDKGNSYEEKIPVLYKIGMNYRFNNQLSFDIAKDNSFNNFLLNRFAIKINNIRNNYGFRLGGAIRDYYDITFLPSLGFYYSGKLFKNKIFKLSYGLNFGSVNEGISHIFTWAFMIDSKKIKN